MDNRIDFRKLFEDSWEIIRADKSIRLFALFAVSTQILDPGLVRFSIFLQCVVMILTPITLYLFPIGKIGMILVVKKRANQEEVVFSQLRSEANTKYWRMVFLMLVLAVVFFLPVICLYFLFTREITSTFSLYLIIVGILTRPFTSIAYQGMVIDEMKPLESLRNSVIFGIQNIFSLLLIDLVISLPVLVIFGLGSGLISVISGADQAASGLSTTLSYVLFTGFWLLTLASSYIVSLLNATVFSLLYYRNANRQISLPGGN